MYEEVVIYDYNDPSSTLLLSIRVDIVHVGVSTLSYHVRMCSSLFYLCAHPFGPLDIVPIPFLYISAPVAFFYLCAYPFCPPDIARIKL